MLTTSAIRSAFLEFFRKNGHEVVPSASLVPHNDPTLMFTNAGMVPFKNVFTGMEKRSYQRAASSQKCVRAGGKHNDLDNVGYTARHHTFFEMLGNFSFGDYFKERAIELAWKLLTQEFGLPPEKLTATIYHTDDEAFGLWKKISGLPESRIIRIATNDNFWAMGETGPCGPCSEIFYDHGDKIAGGPPGSPDADGDRFVEIWNLVFMQYEQVDKEKRINLPKPSIDTGSGLERVAAVLQGVHDNYGIDLFVELIENIALKAREISGKYYKENAVANRVIADHLRASCFLLADGVMPSNEGRGYVLRRIMRRAMRYAHQMGCQSPLMYHLVLPLVNKMGDAYPELRSGQWMIIDILRQEEERFKQTLDRGLKLLEEEAAKVPAKGTLPGDVAFKLYDTYGFPLDLTQDILRGQHKAVDHAGFEASMKEQKDRARAAWAGSGDKATSRIWFDIKEKVGPTEFLGYSQDHAEAQLLAIVVDGKEVQEAPAGSQASLIFNQTPFYGESGGQMGDSGIAKIAGKVVAEIDDTQKPLDNFHVHQAEVKLPLKVGDAVALEINSNWRDCTRANHSATHLLHAVLRHVLGDHVTQKGSLVAPEKLRFDFSHPKAMTKDEIEKVEREVNNLIWKNTPVETRLMKPEEAIKKGAMALFGEKYGDEVRVLSMGFDGDRPYSVELCGGTHVRATGDIGLFKIMSESAVAAGIRRIEAVTRNGAFYHLARQDTRLKELSAQLKTNPEEVIEKLNIIINERKKLEKELSEAKKSAAMGGGAATAEKETIGSITFAAQTYDIEPKELRSLAESLLQSIKVDVAVASSGFGGKASLVVAISKDATGKANAVDLVQPAVVVVGGKGGGGRPEMAQGGGPDAGKLPEAIDAIRTALAKAH